MEKKTLKDVRRGHLIYTITERFDDDLHYKYVVVASRKVNIIIDMRQLKQRAFYTNDVECKEPLSNVILLKTNKESQSQRFGYDPKVTHCFSEQALMREVKRILKRIKETIAKSKQKNQHINTFYQDFMPKLTKIIDKSGYAELEFKR